MQLRRGQSMFTTKVRDWSYLCGTGPGRSFIRTFLVRFFNWRHWWWGGWWWGFQSHFHVQLNYSVEVVFLVVLCCRWGCDNICAKILIPKIRSQTAELMLIWTNVSRIYVARTNVYMAGDTCWDIADISFSCGGVRGVCKTIFMSNPT